MDSQHLRHIAIIGGGVAGIAAALSARRSGARVTLFESLPLLGGRVAGRQRIDTGRHLVLSCYNSFLALLRELGSEDELALHPLEFSAFTPSGTVSLPFHRGVLPGAVAAGINIGTSTFLPPRDRPSALAALTRSLRSAPAEPGDSQLAGDGTGRRFRRMAAVSVAELFLASNWPDSLIDRLGIPLAYAMGNTPPDQLAAGPFLAALKRVLLDPNPRGGWVRDEEYGAVVSDIATERLEQRGIEVRLGTGVRQVSRNHGQWVTEADGDIFANAVVVAVPPVRLRLLENVDSAAPLLDWASRQAGRGILTLRARTQALSPQPGPLAESEVPYGVWFAEAQSDGTTLLERVVSGLPNGAVHDTRPWIVEFAAQARARFGVHVDAGTVTLRWYPDATSSLRPGGLRPALRQGPGLYYASDLSATGLPATLESAARAGTVAGHLASGG